MQIKVFALMKLHLPGEIICEADDYIRGHGTQVEKGCLVSSYLGSEKIINKLVTIVPLMSFRYIPEIGDVVVGRVVSIYNKKWKIEMNCRSEVSLNLSAINLPGIAQRRKLEIDEISMREYFDINDLIVAEVQKINKSGSVNLHTRNEKYKKLSKGSLVTMPASLVPQLKTRFIYFTDVEIIVGSNGYVWVCPLEDNDESLKKSLKIVKKLKESVEKMETPNFNNLL